MKRDPDPRRYRVVAADTLAPAPWWARRWLLALAVVASIVPLLGSALPPLIDLPGHVAIYHIELGVGHDPLLARLFAWRWQVVGNIGAELLVWPLAHLLGLEPAVRVIVLAIPLLTAAGILLVAREANGTLSPTAFFALPLAYGLPFQYGFVNYALSAALMLCALGGWMRLGRLGRYRLRAWLFVPGAALLFLCHCVGWAMLGLAIGAVELVSAREAGLQWRQVPGRAVGRCWPLLPSMLLLATWLGGGTSDPSQGFFLWSRKLLYAWAVLWNGQPPFDFLATLILYLLILTAAMRVRLRFEPRLGLAALLMLGMFLAMPQRAIGSFFADMRIAPFAAALAIAAIVPKPSLSPRAAGALAIAGLSLWAGRLAAQVETYRTLEARQAGVLAAVDHIPRGARVFTVAGTDCLQTGMAARLYHLGAMALVRRDAFVNGVWSIASGQLVQVRDPADRAQFFSETGQFRLPSCPVDRDRPAAMMATLRGSGAGYVWMIGMPQSYWPAGPAFRPVWVTPDSALFRIAR